MARMYAEKEQQCLAAGVACRYPANAIVLFLVAESVLDEYIGGSL